MNHRESVKGTKRMGLIYTAALYDHDNGWHEGKDGFVWFVVGVDCGMVVGVTMIKVLQAARCCDLL